MRGLIKSAVLSVGLAVGRRLWRKYRQRRSGKQERREHFGPEPM
ncbi:hypothetical protein GCM10027447_06860 [Glycomyces halotolerans]